MDTVPHGSFHCDVCEISYYSWNCVLLSQYFLSGLSWKIYITVRYRYGRYLILWWYRYFLIHHFFGIDICGSCEIGSKAGPLPSCRYFRSGSIKIKFYKVLLIFSLHTCCVTVYVLRNLRAVGTSFYQQSLHAKHSNDFKLITIYAPVIYTAPCIMFWMGAYT